MKDLTKQYKLAKNSALNFMKKGQINAYLKSLNEINKYEKLIYSFVVN